MKDLAQSLGRVCEIGPNSNIDVQVQAHLKRVSFACVSPTGYQGCVWIYTGMASVFSGVLPGAPTPSSRPRVPLQFCSRPSKLRASFNNSSTAGVVGSVIAVLETHRKVNYKTLHDIGDSAVPSASTYMPKDGESTTGAPPRTLGTEISHQTFFW